jgi:hypothetical protein
MVDEGFLTPEQLNIALAEQSRTERPLGAILVELGFVSAGAVANALAEQHGGLLKTEFGISAGLYALPGGATRKAAAAAAVDPVEARTRELETQLQAVLRERNAMAQRLNEQAVRLTEGGQAAEAHEAELARVKDAASAHIAGLEAKLQSALSGRDELVAELRREVAELRAQAERRRHEQDASEAAIGQEELEARLNEAAEAQAAEVARVTDAAAAHIAALETEHRSALAGRDELVSELRREIEEMRDQAERRQHEQATGDAAGQEELRDRLNEAAQAHETELARITDAAVEHIAALEAKLQSAVAGRDELVSELQREVAELRAQAADAEHAEEEAAGDEAPIGRAHLLFVPSASGYALIDFAGPDPPSGTVLDIEGVRYVVRRVGASPFPGGRLRCVFVEPV